MLGVHEKIALIYRHDLSRGQKSHVTPTSQPEPDTGPLAMHDVRCAAIEL